MKKGLRDKVLAEADEIVIQEPVGWVSYERFLSEELRRSKPDLMSAIAAAYPGRDPVDLVIQLLKEPRKRVTEGRRVIVGPFSAWLIGWDSANPAADVADRVVGFVNRQKGSRFVADLVEFLYAQATSTVAELATYAKRPAWNPYRASRDGESLYCGANPMLTAQPVRDIQVEVGDQNDLEIITWSTTPRYITTEAGPSLAALPRRKEFHRLHTGPVSNEATWDRLTGGYKAEWLERMKAVGTPHAG